MVSVTSPRGIAIQQAQSSTIRDRIERITEDLKDIKDFYPISISPRRTRELSRYLTSELESLRNLPFDHYDQDGKVDCLLVKNYLERQIRQLDLDLKQDKKAAPLLPFSATLIDLCEARALVLSLDPKEAAQKLFQSQVQMAALLEKIKKSSSRFQIEKTTAFRAVRTTDALRRHLKEWFNFYKGYDPMFDWWVKSPYVTVDKSLEDISLSIQEELVGIKPENDNAIVGDPIGREGLVSELMAEVIAYTPEEIISIGQKEFKWCVDELKKASHAMGYGGNWKEALEEVKHDFVEPGKQTDLVRDLTREAISFVDEHKLVTVPPIAKETWQMFMMSPERQKSSMR
ncbi:hypothetical protein N7508_006614 [Penicillium antarcticum]|uniref:uncharacterized protein n=1 Tax=Penicillium antarcticum TaxID=416450 RepID=UPI0023A310DF|nr:uncharacterized protein N7508_006614 [Penicillium antarcticum]KAJ5301751.1 hypothetical protein N7508_006614 [Penicillium antarcticum]